MTTVPPTPQESIEDTEQQLSLAIQTIEQQQKALALVINRHRDLIAKHEAIIAAARAYVKDKCANTHNHLVYLLAKAQK